MLIHNVSKYAISRTIRMNKFPSCNEVGPKIEILINEYLNLVANVCGKILNILRDSHFLCNVINVIL